jgi:indolepyruvate ferredoxin oxidoreductase alpha subunit
MHENLCEILINNGARLLYTTNRSIGNTLKIFKDAHPAFHYELSTNEKIAYELALAGSISSKRTACIFSAEGLYEALDPLMSSAYTGIVGGLVVLCIKDTEEEVTPLGPFSKLPVIISGNAETLFGTIEYAYRISEKYEIPVIVQAEGDQGSESQGSRVRGFEGSSEGIAPGAEAAKLQRCLNAKGTQNSKFVKDPGRWAATPKFRFQLHKILNEKTAKIRDEFERYEGNIKTIHGSKSGIITNKREVLEFYSEDTDVLYLSSVYPLPEGLVNTFIDGVEEVYVIEGEYPVIELQIPDRTKIKAEHINSAPGRPKPEEKMYGFKVVRDNLGAASSINMAHGIKKLEPEKKILAITFEEHFFHSGMPALVNTIYNDSSYVLLILTNEREEEIKNILRGFDFHNYHHIDNVSEIEKFNKSEELTVLFYKGII